MHELFTGKRVFEADDFNELSRLHQNFMTTSLASTSQLDLSIDHVIHRCLETDPAKRPAAALAVAAPLLLFSLAGAVAVGFLQSGHYVDTFQDRDRREMPEPAQDRRLTEEEHWNKLYQNSAPDTPIRAVEPESDSDGRTGILREVPGRLMDEFIGKHFQPDSALSVLEVGSAPGGNVLGFHRRFGYQPFGVEYIENGAAVNRQTFLDAGISPDNVIHADFLDDEFQAEYKDAFEVVVSFGFIEHFDNPRDIVAKHVNVLKPGGTLLVTIPNFRYLNFLMRRFYYSSFVDSHNLELMAMEPFRSCFERQELEIIESAYSGGFKFPQPTYTVPWKRFVERITGKLQLLVNVLHNAVFGGRPLESRYFSYQLVCLARKNAVA